MSKSETDTIDPSRLPDLMPMLQKRARRLTSNPSDAEDLAQETLVRLVKKLGEGRAIDDLPAYAMRTLHNQARMLWRRAPAPVSVHATLRSLCDPHPHPEPADPRRSRNDHSL